MGWLLNISISLPQTNHSPPQTKNQYFLYCRGYQEKNKYFSEKANNFLIYKNNIFYNTAINKDDKFISFFLSKANRIDVEFVSTDSSFLEKRDKRSS